MLQRAPSNRKFGFSFAVIFLIFGAWFTYQSYSFAPVLFVVSGLTFLIAALKPNWLSSLNKKWMALGFFLQKHLNPVFMGVIYLTIFTLVGFILRIFKRNFFSLKMEPQSDTYWIKTPTESHSTMKDQF